MGRIYRLQKIFFHLLDGRGIEEQGSILHVEEEGTVIQINRPNAGGVIVDDEHLFVNESRGILVNFHAGFEQFLIIGTG